MKHSLDHAFSVPFGDGYRTITFGSLDTADIDVGSAIGKLSELRPDDRTDRRLGVLGDAGRQLAFVSVYLDVAFSGRHGAVVSHLVRGKAHLDEALRALESFYSAYPNALTELAQQSLGTKRADAAAIEVVLHSIAEAVDKRVRRAVAQGASPLEAPALQQSPANRDVVSPDKGAESVVVAQGGQPAVASRKPSHAAPARQTDSDVLVLEVRSSRRWLIALFLLLLIEGIVRAAAAYVPGPWSETPVRSPGYRRP